MKTDYRRILALSKGQGLSIREISDATGYGKTMIGDFLRRFDGNGILSYPLSDDDTNERIHGLLYSRRGSGSSGTEFFREPDYERIIRALKYKGQTLKRQWRLYDAEGVVDGKRPYSYRQFCQKVSDWSGAQETVSHFVRTPGDIMELDYAGRQLVLHDRDSETAKRVTIYIAVMSYSGYFYAEGLLKCDERNWLRACSNALYFFGGVPKVTTPDNCKVAVTKNTDWIDPVLNEAFQDWGEYYGTAIMPARVRSPKWKPKVENTVGIVTRDILADMSEMMFFSLDSLNAELWRRVDERNSQPLSGMGISRRDLFERDEKDKLLQLPSERYQYFQAATAKVSKDLGVTFDHVHYTMLRRYVGEVVEIRASESYVRIYSQRGDLIKEYRRSYAPNSWVYDEETAPKTSTDYASWTPELFRTLASQTGPCTLKVIDHVLSSKKYANQTFRSCWGILSFRKRYGSEVLESCCENACRSGRMNYSYIRDTIGDFTEAGDADDGKMRYKADDSPFSLDSLLRRQGNGKAD